MATQKKKAPAKKETALKKDVEPQELQEKEETRAVEKPQNEQKSEEKAASERKVERVITILSKEDSEFLSQFDLSRSAVSRAVLRGSMEFLQQDEFKSATEAEIIEAIRNKLK